MLSIAPLDPIRRIELQRLTEDNGFGLPQGESEGWSKFIGLAIPQTLYVAPMTDDSWLVGIAHSGVMDALMGDSQGDPMKGLNGVSVVTVSDLGPTIRRIARLARSLPTAPLDDFISQTKALPKATEAERLVVQRVGQDVFRAALMDYWNGTCPLTGIAQPRLLRASHMKPWADCETDAERLDVHNGLLLSANLDAAFDAGLISFDLDGSVVVSPTLPQEDNNRLGLPNLPPLKGLLPSHQPYLNYHREVVFIPAASNSGETI